MPNSFALPETQVQVKAIKASIKKCLKISIVFDETESARVADALVKPAAPDNHCEIQSLRFDELTTSKSGVAAALRCADSDTLVLAVRGDQHLPSHVRLWLGLCLGLGGGRRNGAMVALITKASLAADLPESLVEYLGTVEGIGGRVVYINDPPSEYDFSLQPGTRPICSQRRFLA